MQHFINCILVRAIHGKVMGDGGYGGKKGLCFFISLGIYFCLLISGEKFSERVDFIVLSQI